MAARKPSSLVRSFVSSGRAAKRARRKAQVVNQGINVEELEKRVADLPREIAVAERRDGSVVTARDLKADGAMAALLRDALAPNLVQTLEGSPALVHGGPFANIAHGCSSVIATRLGLNLADVVLTEAGFGADLGGEKFLDIKCRQAGLEPSCAVIVATIRALKMHGGVAKDALGAPDVAAMLRGADNLLRHIENIGKFGLPMVVAVNDFTGDTEEERAALADLLAPQGVTMVPCTHWAEGGAGAVELAEAVMGMLAQDTARFAPIYPDAMPLAEKIAIVAREIYRADGIDLAPATAKRLAAIEAAGYGDLPVCIAKTPYSFSADPGLLGAPLGFTLPVREVRLAAGAGFVVALAGNIMTMPGLPRVPAAEGIGLDESGRIVGLF